MAAGEKVTKRMQVLRNDGSVLLGNCQSTENAWERMCGLLPRRSLEAGEGLWIAPSPSIHTFFMRFTIDVAFLDRSGKVLKLYSRLKPWRHSGIHPFAAGALEASAGALDGVREGEVLRICPVS